MNEMRDGVRETLECVIERLRNGADSIEIADAILARFDVTPKPAIGALDLGLMVAAVVQADDGFSYLQAGRRMLDQLDAAGLKIVRDGAGSALADIGRETVG